MTAGVQMTPQEAVQKAEDILATFEVHQLTTIALLELAKAYISLAAVKVQLEAERP